MILYTRQGSDFNLIRDKVDLLKSTHYADCFFGFKKAYDFLFEKLSHDQWIWCHATPYFSDMRFVKPEYPKERLWVLDVPDKHITCINRNMWDYIINDWKWFGNDHFYNYVKELDIDQKWIDKLDEAMESLPKEETWKNIVRKNKKEWLEEDDYLIKAPIKKRWVVAVYKLEEESLDGL